MQEPRTGKRSTILDFGTSNTAEMRFVKRVLCNVREGMEFTSSTMNLQKQTPVACKLLARYWWALVATTSQKRCGGR